MNTISANLEALSLLAPELILASAMLLAVFLSFLKNTLATSSWQVYFWVALLLLVFGWLVIQSRSAHFVDNPIVVVNSSIQSVKALIVLVAAVCIIQLSIDPDIFNPAEWPIFIICLLANLLGIFVWLSANHIVLFIVALELVSLSAYVLTGILRSSRSETVSLKYLLFGAFSLGLLLFGFSLLFPFFSGSLYLHHFQPSVAPLLGVESNVIVWIGLSLFLCGIFFKAALFPMHIWTPAIYEPQRPSLLTFLSVAPKIAAIMVLFRLANVFHKHMLMILCVVCVLTILVASVAALREDNLKRLFAFSSVAHSGYMLVNVIHPTTQSFQYLFLYMIGYWMMNTAFTTYMQMAGDNIVKMNDFSGVAKRNPVSSLLFTWNIAAMIGLPPTGGFIIKFFTFLGLWGKADYIDIKLIYLLLIVGLGSIIISFFYYFKIPYRIYFKKLSYDSPPIFRAPVNLFFMLMASLLLLFLFLFPFEILKFFNLYDL